jgi:hypothetical protein
LGVELAPRFLFTTKEDRMSGFRQGVAVTLVFMLAPDAWAHGLRRHVEARAYYYPVPVLVAPAVVPAPAIPYVPARVSVEPPLVCPPGAIPPAPVGGAAPAPAYARPTPAPPSTTPPASQTPTPGGSQPAPTPRTPSAGESRSYFDLYAVTPGTPEQAAGRAAVGFWNLSGRELSVVVAGQNYVIPQGKSLRTNLAREFVWSVVGREPQQERVPDAVPALEVVIRR